MRAVIIEQDEDGRGFLKPVERPDPEPGGAEVRVRVQDAGVNRADLLQRRGLYPVPPGAPQDIPGLEYTGVIDAVGPGVTLRRVGERVMGLVGGGGYAEYVVAHERETVAVPDNLDPVAAAAVPEVFMTAHRALVVEGGLQAGEPALIRAATSGVGMAAVQLAHVLGAVAIGTSRSSERLERLRPLGLTHGHEDGSGALEEAVRGWTGGRGAAMVLDLIGGGALKENMAALRDEGRLVLVGVMGGPRDELDMGRLLRRRLSLRGMTMRSLPLERRIGFARDFEARFTEFFADERLRPVVSDVLELEQADEAHRRMEAGGHFGKVVLKVSD